MSSERETDALPRSQQSIDEHERRMAALAGTWDGPRVELILERLRSDLTTSNHMQKQAARLIIQMQQWVADLLGGLYVNCVYCGHRYGPVEDTPTSNEQLLFEHIIVCPQHPLRAAREGLFAAIGYLRILLGRAEAVHKKYPQEHQITIREVPEWINYLSGLLGSKPPEVPDLVQEKARRIYYQDIVYDLCRQLDTLLGRKPGMGVVSGTLEAPSKEPQLALQTFQDQAKHYRELQNWFPRMADGELMYPDRGVYQIHSADEALTWFVKHHRTARLDTRNSTTWPYPGCIPARCYSVLEDAEAEARRRTNADRPDTGRSG